MKQLHVWPHAGGPLPITVGRVTEYSGAWRDGALRFEAAQPQPDGSISLLKMTFTPLPDGAVRQHGETSTDNGKSWSSSFDFTYRRKSP